LNVQRALLSKKLPPAKFRRYLFKRASFESAFFKKKRFLRDLCSWQVSLKFQGSAAVVIHSLVTINRGCCSAEERVVGRSLWQAQTTSVQRLLVFSQVSKE